MNLLTQPRLGTTVLNHGYSMGARWGQMAGKEKNLSLKKEELIYDAKTKRLRVICSSPDGRTGWDAGVAGLVLRPV